MIVVAERRRLRRKMVRWWEGLEGLVFSRSSFLLREAVMLMAGVLWEYLASCFSVLIPRKSNRILYVILQSEGGMALSKASSLKMWKIHSSVKKPRRLLISAHVVMSVT